MDFSLSQEHNLAQKMVRNFARQEIAPAIKEYDRKAELMPHSLKRMAGLRSLGLCSPLRYESRLRAGQTHQPSLRCKLPAYDESFWQG